MYQITSKNLKRHKSGWSWRLIVSFILVIWQRTGSAGLKWLHQIGSYPPWDTGGSPFLTRELSLVSQHFSPLTYPDFITVNMKIKGVGASLDWHVGQSARGASMHGLRGWTIKLAHSF